MGTGIRLFHRQYRIEQQHALLRPGLQAAMIRWLNAQVVLDFLEDIHQRRRNLHAGAHRKAQTVGLTRAMVGVLPQDHHFYPVQGCAVEGIKTVAAFREQHLARALLARQELRQLLHIGLAELISKILIPATAGSQLLRQSFGRGHGLIPPGPGPACAPGAWPGTG